MLDGRQGRGRDVTSRLQDPPEGVAEVADAATEPGLVPGVASYGASVGYGEVSLQVLWPPPGGPTVGPGDGSTANDASVVLLAEVARGADPAHRRRRAAGPGRAGPAWCRACRSTC